MAALKRINKELSALQSSEEEHFSAQPTGDDVFEWTGTVIGPEETPYDGGCFFLAIEFPKDYPFKPPKVKFQTKIYHCNVDDNGAICLPMLKDEWSPTFTIKSVLQKILDLLLNPNTDSPLKTDIAQLYLENKAQHDKNAKEATDRYAC